jgi:hypothetical protein
MTTGADGEEQGGERVALLVIALACLFVGGIFGAIGGRSAVTEWKYKWSSGRTDAVAIGKALRFATDTTNTGYEVSYTVEIEGRRHARTEAVPVSLWERLEPGALVPIEYLRRQPDTFRVPVAGDEMRRGLTALAIGAVLILVGLAFVVAALRPRMFSIGRGGDPADRPIVEPLSVPTYWSAARRSATVWLGAILLTVGMPFAAVGLSAAHREWRFSNDAVAIEGMVLTKESRRSGRANRRTNHAATYRFELSGRTFEGRTQLPRGAWAPLVERQPATVLYLPYAPATSRLAGTRAWGGPLAMAAIGSLFTVIGARVFVQSLRSVATSPSRDRTRRTTTCPRE